MKGIWGFSSRDHFNFSVNLKSFQNKKGYSSKKLTESETIVAETGMKIQRAPREGEKDQDPGEPSHFRNPKTGQGSCTSKRAEGPSSVLGVGASQRQSQDPPQTTEASRAWTMGGWTGTADGASSGGLAGEPTASARGAQWISGRDSPHRRQWLLSAFILYLPSTFTFSDHCSKKTHMRKVLQKERVQLAQGLSPRTLSPGSCHTQALEGKEPRWQEGATANPALLRDHSPKGRCHRRTFSADS